MMQFHKAMAIWMIALFGLWGCSKAPPSGPSPERVKALEDDLKSAYAQRDQVNSKLRNSEVNVASHEKEIERLQGIVKQTSHERDDAQNMIKVRTTERDALQTQYESFRKTLKDLIGQAEVTLNRPVETTPTTTVEGPKLGGPALLGATAIPMTPAGY